MVIHFRRWTWQWETWLFGAIAFLAGLYALFGKKPWQTGMAERHAAGKPAFLIDYMNAGFWWGAVIVCWLAILLTVSARIWARGANIPARRLTDKPGAPSRRFLIILLVILAVSLVPRIMRMDHSFWGDEAWWYADLVGGRYSVNEDNSLDFKRHTWTISFFFDKSLNNHYLYTIAARGCDEVWRTFSGAEPHMFSEAAVRIPALIAGVLGIGLGALLLRRCGYEREGLIFAVLLAFHPWHVRYSSEARGYTFLLLFLTLVLWFLLEALETGRWRWWVLFAAGQFFALYSWKAAIHPLGAFNFIALAIILQTRGTGREGMLQFGRWGAANVVTLMAYIPLFMPAVYQIQRKLATSVQEGGSVHPNWFKDVAARFFRGTDWLPQRFETPFDSMGSFLDRWPVPGWLAMGVVVFLWGAGVWRMVSTNWMLAALVSGPALGAILALAHFQLNGNYLKIWYVFYVTPVLMAFVATGMSWIFNGWGEGSRGRTGMGLAASGVVALTILFWRPLTDYARFPVQDPRGASEITRYRDEGRWYLGPSDIVTVGLYRRSVLYDPRMKQKIVVDGKRHRLRTPELLKRVMKEIDEAPGSMAPSKLRVSIANLLFADLYHPEFLELVRDDRFFSSLAAFPAIEDYIRIECYDYRPGSLTLHGGEEPR